MQFPISSLAPHQIEGLQAILDEFAHEARAQAHMACGSGKTRLGQAVAALTKGSQILVLVPSLPLLSQTLKSWQALAEIPSSTLMCVCSDPYIAEQEDDDGSIIPELPVQVTTTPTDIRAFAEARAGQQMIVFCTYHSVPTLIAGLPIGFVFNIGIFDEAHRTAGPKNGQFAAALHDYDTMTIAKRLFLTATPRHLPDPEAGLGSGYSMDDEALYGRTAYTLSLHEAISRRIITDYRIIITVIDDAETSEARQQLWSALRDVDHHTALQAMELLVAMKGVGARKAFTFHSRISRSKEFSHVLKAVAAAEQSAVRAWHVDGSMRTSERTARLTEFEQAGEGVVSNARCLTEGVDSPAVDLAAFMDPRESPTDIIQVLGRTLRMRPGKECGYILLPIRIHLRPGMSVEQAIAASPMSHVWGVLSALADQDAAVMDELRTARRYVGRTGSTTEFDFHKSLLSKIEIRGVDAAIAGLSRYLRHKVVEVLTSSWDAYYGALQLFHERHGHCNVPRSFTTDSHLRLGGWCGLQRVMARKGTLAPSRRADLEALNFDFEPRTSSWEKAFNALVDYHQIHGVANVPFGHVTAAGFALGTWCGDQRKAFASGSLSTDRERQLRTLGFSFRVIDDTWNANLELLKAFVREHGHSAVPGGTPGAFKTDLGSWVQNQRQRHDDSEKRALLEEAGLRFDTSFQQTWENAFAALLQYRDLFGNCSPKLSYVTPDNFKLGEWVSNQRQRKKSGLLEQSRVTRLESVQFVFDVEQAAFERGMRALLDFREVHGHCDVPRSYQTSEGFNLGSWCSSIRSRLGLPSYMEQRAALAAVGFIFSLPEHRWNQMYEAACEYLTSTGAQSLPVKYVSPGGLKVGAWLSRQKVLISTDKLPAESVAKLKKARLI